MLEGLFFGGNGRKNYFSRLLRKIYMKIYLTVIGLLTLTWAHAQSKAGAITPVQIEVTAKFYPNPASTQITFECGQWAGKNYQFQVFNFIGKKMVDRPVTEKMVVPVSEFYRGIYIFQIRDRMGRVVHSGKFQVSH